MFTYTFNTPTAVLAPTYEIATSVIAHVTVEAEYGAKVVKGEDYTAAHHQAGMECRPAPCNDSNIPALGAGIVLTSHLDPDSIGGCLRTFRLADNFAQLFEPEHGSFWELVSFLDKNGLHQIEGAKASNFDKEKLYAFLAWFTTDVPKFPRDKLSDITDTIIEAGEVLVKILVQESQVWLDRGAAFREARKELNAKTYSTQEENVLVRVTDDELGFCNDLYEDMTGNPQKAVVTYNKDAGSITISVSDASANVNCRDIVQSLWGEEAGGHPGIAGSPRGQHMALTDVTNVVKVLNTTIAA